MHVICEQDFIVNHTKPFVHEAHEIGWLEPDGKHRDEYDDRGKRWVRIQPMKVVTAPCDGKVNDG